RHAFLNGRCRRFPKQIDPYLARLSGVTKMVQPAIRYASLVAVLGLCLVWGLPAPTADDEPAQAHEQAKDEPKVDPQDAENVVANLKRIGELIKQLDHDKFEVRQKASDELVKIGRPAIAPLKMLLASRPNLELAKRATGILEAMPKEKI